MVAPEGRQTDALSLKGLEQVNISRYTGRHRRCPTFIKKERGQPQNKKGSASLGAGITGVGAGPSQLSHAFCGRARAGIIHRSAPSLFQSYIGSPLQHCAGCWSRCRPLASIADRWPERVCDNLWQAKLGQPECSNKVKVSG